MNIEGQKRHHSQGEDTFKSDISLDRHEREYCTSVVTDLPKSTNIKSINSFFQICGSIKQTKFLKSKQAAKIQFSCRKEMLSSLTMSFKHFNNNPQSPIITVEPYENSSLWVTNYPVDYSYIEIKSMFEEILGVDTVFEVRLPSLQFNSNKRFAYVDLLSTDMCAKAITELNGKKIGEYKLIVKMNGSKNKDNKIESDSQDVDNSKELYLTNLKSSYGDEKVFKLFKEKCGCVNDKDEEHFVIPIKRPNQGKIKNIGFIVFKKTECVEKILTASKENKKFFLNLDKKHKLFYQKVESKGYLERMKFKKMIKFGQTLKDYNLWMSMYPLFDDKIKYLNKYQLSNYLESEIPGSKVVEVLLVTDHKGVLIKFANEKDVSKARLKFNNNKCLQIRNVKYSNDIIKCGTVLDLAETHSSSPIIITDKKKVVIDNNSSEQDKPTETPTETKQMTTADFKSLFH
ncbi:uncharacterized protein HGUI_01820 [Hanseniaspora guilliermondii]|uniref:RRM domain-containing protein n=1 Tax=Hanseniaspora guilliermondii TaxID=56406 RepID=A0A1L0B1F7_9ASCO|nr:uncharacterized protein HGUI_01820 [Hanseniaspora guilliermondii]